MVELFEGVFDQSEYYIKEQLNQIEKISQNSAAIVMLDVDDTVINYGIITQEEIIQRSPFIDLSNFEASDEARLLTAMKLGETIVGQKLVDPNIPGVIHRLNQDRITTAGILTAQPGTKAKRSAELIRYLVGLDYDLPHLGQPFRKDSPFFSTEEFKLYRLLEVGLRARGSLGGSRGGSRERPIIMIDDNPLLFKLLRDPKASVVKSRVVRELLEENADVKIIPILYSPESLKSNEMANGPFVARSWIEVEKIIRNLILS